MLVAQPTIAELFMQANNQILVYSNNMFWFYSCCFLGVFTSRVKLLQYRVYIYISQYWRSYLYQIAFLRLYRHYQLVYTMSSYELYIPCFDTPKPWVTPPTNMFRPRPCDLLSLAGVCGWGDRRSWWSNGSVIVFFFCERMKPTLLLYIDIIDRIYIYTHTIYVYTL